LTISTTTSTTVPPTTEQYCDSSHKIIKEQHLIVIPKYHDKNNYDEFVMISKWYQNPKKFYIWSQNMNVFIDFIAFFSSYLEN